MTINRKKLEHIEKDKLVNSESQAIEPLQDLTTI